MKTKLQDDQKRIGSNENFKETLKKGRKTTTTKK